MKHLVMLGAAQAHIHMLSTLAAQPMAGVKVTLVAPYPRQLYSGMVPGFVAGHYALQDCAIPLKPLMANSGVEWLQHNATGLDARTHTLTLDDGRTVDFDVLSINSEPVQDRQKIEQMIPGARENALFVRPLEGFGTLWPQVLEMSPGRALRITVIGGGAAAIELACAVAYRLKNASVTLLSGDTPLAPSYPQAVQTRLRKALKSRGITIIQERAVGVAAGEVMLANGARLACDVPIMAIGSQAPTWLPGSGLTLDEQGFIAVDGYQRSVSHPKVFAAGDVCSRTDRPLARSGFFAGRTGLPLTKNLRAALAGVAPSMYLPQKKTLRLLSCGDQYAIASWGRWSAQGRWLWWLKDRIDRGVIKKYSRPAPV
jgi:pyridine nucleotide-disulfide oxidoreductase family protein